MAQSSNAPRSHEDYITLVSEEIKGRVRKKLFQQFSRKENRILGALSRLDDFLMYPLIQGHSGTALEMSRNAYGKNQGNPQSDPHPEAGLFQSQTTRNSGPKGGYDRGVLLCLVFFKFESGLHKFCFYHFTYF